MVQQHTASGTKRSIWTPISEGQFLQKAKDVSIASKQVAGSFSVYDRSKDVLDQYAISYRNEYEIAQDIAFIAAHGEQVATVSAATVTVTEQGSGIVIAVASNEGVQPCARKSLASVVSTLQQRAKGGMKADRDNEIMTMYSDAMCLVITPERCLGDLLQSIVELDELKIISRLKCKRWVPPRAFKSEPPPLLHSLRETFSSVLRTSTVPDSRLQSISCSLENLVPLVDSLDNNDSTNIHEVLKPIVYAAGKLVAYNSSLEKLLSSMDITLSYRDDKAVKAFDKLANYWRVCIRLNRAASETNLRYHFLAMELVFVEHYARQTVNGLSRYVHAEVQLATYHRQQKTSPPPRTIGTSKAACYLCNSFLAHHTQYSVSATHGMLYDLWTIPDLNTYDEDDRQELRDIIRSMYNDLAAWSRPRYHPIPQFPIQSGIFHPPYQQSQAGTVVSLLRPSDQGTTNSTIKEVSEKPSATQSLGAKSVEFVSTVSQEAFSQTMSGSEDDPATSSTPAMPKTCKSDAHDGDMQKEKNISRPILRIHGKQTLPHYETHKATDSTAESMAVHNTVRPSDARKSPSTHSQFVSNKQRTSRRRRKTSYQHCTAPRSRNEQIRQPRRRDSNKRSKRKPSGTVTRKSSEIHDVPKNRAERRQHTKRHRHKRKLKQSSFMMKLTNVIGYLLCCVSVRS